MTAREVEGDLTAREVEGDLTAREVEGHLTAREVEGHLTAREAERDLTAREAGEDLTAREVEGHLTARGVEGHLTARGVEGHLTAREAEGNYESYWLGKDPSKWELKAIGWEQIHEVGSESSWLEANLHHHHLSLNCEDHWGTIDDFTTSFLHSSLFSTALWDLANSRPVHSLILSSHLFLCLPCLLPPFTVPCKMVLARPDIYGRHVHTTSICIYIFLMIRRSLCSLIVFPLSLCLARWFWPDLMNGRHDTTHCSLRLFMMVRRSSCGLIA